MGETKRKRERRERERKREMSAAALLLHDTLESQDGLVIFNNRRM
jgi:hypothetical protein